MTTTKKFKTIDELWNALYKEGKKIRHKIFNENEFLYFDENEKSIRDENGYQEEMLISHDFYLEDWELYEEPKKKEKYYKWIIFDDTNKAVTFSTLFNENGYTTNGTFYGDDWNKIKKQKIETVFIEA